MSIDSRGIRRTCSKMPCAIHVAMHHGLAGDTEEINVKNLQSSIEN